MGLTSDVPNIQDVPDGIPDISSIDDAPEKPWHEMSKQEIDGPSDDGDVPGASGAFQVRKQRSFTADCNRHAAVEQGQGSVGGLIL